MPPASLCCAPAQVLQKKYMSAVNQKVEAEEAALQAQADADQLLQLCEFCESAQAQSARFRAFGSMCALPLSHGSLHLPP